MDFRSEYGSSAGRAHNVPGPAAHHDHLSQEGRVFLARLLGALRVFDMESPGLRFPLVDLPDGDRRLIENLLGFGHRIAAVAGDPHRSARETAFAAVWRCRVVAEDGKSLFDWIELADVPSFIAETVRAFTRRSPQTENRDLSAVANLACEDAELVTATIRKVIAAAGLYRAGQPNVQVPLSSLCQRDELAEALKLGFGTSGAMLVDRHSDPAVITASATALPHVWLIESICADAGQARCSVEIGDIPTALRAPANALQDSAGRMEHAVEHFVYDGS